MVAARDGGAVVDRRTSPSVPAKDQVSRGHGSLQYGSLQY